ncbi:MAG: PQQ-like beta-propeller repeat protein, partial [Verrucomicrobia bacterium]|nr:PQQ-like beta-propeller repeat protein [Verrucomicrobiota bacterium]
MTLLARTNWKVWALLIASTISLGAQENWPSFRGESASGVSEASNLPMTWGENQNIAWKKELAGRGWASPIVWRDQIFLTTVVSSGEVEAPKKGLYFGGERPEPAKDVHRWMVLSLDEKSGEILWQTQLKEAPPSSTIHIKNTYASETPVTDGKHLYVYFGYMGLYCLNLQGEVVWKHNWEPRKTRYGWGTSSSPILHGDSVIIVNDNEEESYVAAFDKNSGQPLWKTKRDEPTNFSTPFIWKNSLRNELITTGVRKTRAYDLTGEPLWEFKGMSTICIPTPFADGDLLFVAAGYVGDNERPNKPVYVVTPGGSGDITPPEGKSSSEFIAWMQPESAPYNPSPILYKNRLYVLWDFGFFSSRHALTGEEIYEKQRFKPRGRVGFTASPWAYRDHL